MVAAAWSPPGAPASWRLTAAQFEALASDPELLAIAATIPPARLPPLLFEAAATFLVLELEPSPLRDIFPRVGEPQPPIGARFRDEYRAFCLDHRERADRAVRRASLPDERGRPLRGRGARAAGGGRGAARSCSSTSAPAPGWRCTSIVTATCSAGRAASWQRAGDPESEVVIETELRGEACRRSPVRRCRRRRPRRDRRRAARPRRPRRARLARSVHPAGDRRGDALSRAIGVALATRRGWCAAMPARAAAGAGRHPRRAARMRDRTATSMSSSRPTIFGASGRRSIAPARDATSTGYRSIRSCRWVARRRTACSAFPCRRR